MSELKNRKDIICLFDVDGTLTIPRQVNKYFDEPTEDFNMVIAADIPN